MCNYQHGKKSNSKYTKKEVSLRGATFQITDTRLYVPVVTLSTENDKKLLEELKIGFKRTIKWNKHRSK